jgi:phosphoglycerol transferase
MLIASKRTHASLFLVIGLVLLAIYCACPALTERSVQSGPVIASAEFQATPDGFLATSRKAEKILKQKVKLEANQKFRVQFDITGSSGPTSVVVDLAGTSFQLQLNGRALKVDRVLEVANRTPETYLRVSYGDPVKLGIANIRVSEYSRLEGFLRVSLLLLAVLSLAIGLLSFRIHWVPAKSIDPNWSTATLLIFIVGLGAIIRNLAVNYPLIFGDEGIFLIRAKYAGRAYMLAGDELAAWVPNSLYLWLNHSVFFLGSNYAMGARLINVLFFVLSLMLLYGIATLFVSHGKSALVAFTVGVGPVGVYTAVVMPEMMFLCAFLCLAFVFVRHINDQPIYASFLSGVVLGAASLIKPHGLMLIPIVVMAVVILKLSVREWCRWSTCLVAAGTVVGAALATVGFLNYLLLGRFAFSLGPTYATAVNKSTAGWPIASILYVIGGHVALVLSLYALPVLVVLMAFFRGSVATRTLAERISFKALLIFTVLTGCVLLITTSKFTVSVVGQSPFEQANRVHVRYYFFVLPLLLVLFLTIYERLDWTKTWVKNIFLGGSTAMCVFAAYCILVLDRRYNMYFPDFPDGFWFNMIPNIGRRVVLVCTCGTLLAYAWRRMSPAVFLCAFGFVSLVGNFYMSLYVIQPATVTDRAAPVFEKIIGKDRLDAGTVFDTEPGDGEAYRLLFDLPAAYDLKLVTNQDPIAADMFPQGHEWALVTSSRQVKFPYSNDFIFGRYHLYLRGAKPVGRETELVSSVPFLTGACAGGQLIGFQQPEQWGVWSAEEAAKIVLPAEVRGSFRLILAGNILGNQKPQTLQVQIGDSLKSVTLGDEPAIFQLDFALPSPAQAIVFRGITPRSPLQLGLSNDFRVFGFEIEKLDCASETSRPLN